jgi:hypothetical protein
MIDTFVGELVNFISTNRYVNLHSGRFIGERQGQEDLKQIRSRLIEEYGGPVIDVDIKRFHGCETEEAEAGVMLELIHEALEKSHLPDTTSSVLSISEVLEKLNKGLDSRTLVLFHFFSDIHDEKERDILRAIRKFIEIFEKSLYLGILIISDRPTHHWELYPESRLDDRHVFFKEYP